jgi:hypothetical protein
MVLLCVTAAAPAAQVVTQKYDFEPGNGTTATAPSVTATGWTHMDLAIVGTTSTPGFMLAPGTMFYRGGAVPIGTSPNFVDPAPTDVLNEAYYVIGSGDGVTPVLRFREIVPADSDGVSFAIHSNDAGDSFFDHFKVEVNLDADGSIEFTRPAPGLVNVGFYHAPITGSFSFAPSPVARVLDFTIIDGTGFGPNSFVRINGIEVTSLPEPASAVTCVGLLTTALASRRRRIA